MNGYTQEYIIKNVPSLLKGEKGDQGIQGPPGPGADLPLSSNDVIYNGLTLTEVIDQLLYVPLSIATFTTSTLNYEIGTILSSLSVTWSYNKNIVQQTITGPNVISPTLLNSDRSKLLLLNNINSNTDITLTADDNLTDSNAAKTKVLSLKFLNKIYYGKALIPGSFNSSFILSLQGSLASNKTKSFQADAGANEYIWYCIPHSFGTPLFKMNGFDGGMSLVTSITFTNASGYSSLYDIYRSNNPFLGLTNVDAL